MKRFILTILLVLLPLSVGAFTITAYSNTTQKVIAFQLQSTTLSGATVLNDPVIGTSTIEDVLALPSTSQVTINDIIYNQSLTGSVNYHCQIDLPPSSTIVAIDPTILTTNSTGHTTYVSDGTARFNVNTGQITRQVSCASSHTTVSSSNVFSSILSSSLAGYLDSTTTARVQSLSPSATTYNIFSSTDDTNHLYTRNTSLWASSTDLTSIPASKDGQLDKGILVAPDILISAWHACGAGRTVYFVDGSNSVSSRTVSSVTLVDTDICVNKLSSDVPASIHPAKVFPANFYPNKVTSAILPYKVVPVAYTNQYRTLRIGALTNYATWTTVVQATTTSTYNGWYSSVISGDSGNAVVAFVNGQTVAVGTWYTGGSSSIISNWITQINTAMTGLGSAYSLTQIDLSGFPTY